jgi:hypothetical protein
VQYHPEDLRVTADVAEAHVRLAQAIAIDAGLLVPAVWATVALEALAAGTLTDDDVRWLLREVYGYDVLAGSS